MTAPTTFGVSRLLSQLGVKGGGLPGLETRAMQPVIVMGDFSNTLSAEPVETRAIWGGETANIGPPFHSNIQLLAVGAGLVLEEFSFTARPLESFGNHVVVIRRQSTWSAPPAGRIAVPIGGGVPRALFKVSNDLDQEPGAPNGTSFRYPVHPVDRYWRSPPNLRWFIPAGTLLLIQHSVVGIPWRSVHFQWRELSESIGTP